MPPYHIHAGEILLREVCALFNHKVGYNIIEDYTNIHPDKKRELLIFIGTMTNHQCNFGIRALDRLIENVKLKKVEIAEQIPRKDSTLCTLCYIVLKGQSNNLAFHSRNIRNTNHGKQFYADHFNKRFIIPLHSFFAIQNAFIDSCWYLYINNVDNITGKRMTSRKILKIKREDDSIRVQYFSTNILLPDWQGNVEFDNFKKEIRIRLKTNKNEKRNMTMIFQINQSPLPQFIEGDIIYTTMKELDTEKQTKIFIQKSNCETTLSLTELNDGEDSSIEQIENRLKETTCITRKISLNHNCHD